MTHVLHELADKFPEKTDKIHELKLNDGHFSRIFDEYHELNRKIHRIESRGNDRSDDYMEDLKKQRAVLLDELVVMLDS